MGWKQWSTTKQALSVVGAAFALVVVVTAYINRDEHAARRAAEQAAYDSTAAQYEAEAAERRADRLVTNSSWDGSVKQVRDYLSANLNDPDSYDPIEWSPVSRINVGLARYVVRHKYRAANAYGAKILQNQQFFMDSTGTVIAVRPYGQ